MCQRNHGMVLVPGHDPVNLYNGRFLKAESRDQIGGVWYYTFSAKDTKTGEPILLPKVPVYPWQFYQSGSTVQTTKGGFSIDYAYALTCHKAQGNEWPNVVMFDVPNHWFDGQTRRWRYTAVTRAAKWLGVCR